MAKNKKVVIRDYDHFKQLRKDKIIKKKMSAADISMKFKVDWLQLLAWMARYSTEREYEKAHK